MRFALLLVLPALLGACNKPKHYTTTVEVLQVRRFGQVDPKTGGGQTTDLELRYADCPGDARRIMRGDKAFGACASQLKVGDRLEAEVVLAYSSERGMYRNELVRLGSCAVKLDPKEEANYEMVQECRDVVASGAVVGVHCDRQRSDAMLAKCPFLRRK
jgi:hypothetical protein